MPFRRSPERIRLIEVVCAAIAAFAAIMSALVSTKNNAHNKKAEKRAEMRCRENRLMLDMIHANMKLSIGTALAIKNGKANGELSSALEAVSVCDEKYDEFLREIAIAHLTK